MNSIIRRWTSDQASGDALSRRISPLENPEAQSSSGASVLSTNHQNFEETRLQTSQREQQWSVFNQDLSSSASKYRFPEYAWTLERLKDNINELKSLQTDFLINPEGPPQEPDPEIFHTLPSCTVVPPIIDKPLTYCMILLHDHGQNEESLKALARRLQQRLKECLFVLLRGPRPVRDVNGSITGYCWIVPDHNQELANGLFPPCHYVLKAIILDQLNEKCHFRPRNIVILGHGQGALVALHAAALWNDIEFGGVIAVGTPLPYPSQPSPPIKAKTPVLIIKGQSRDFFSDEFYSLKERFSFVDVEKRSARDEEPPTGLHQYTTQENEYNVSPELKPYIDFLVHRLRRDEWRKQDVISFDGGGIRGYGSLLILKALMEKIADEEKSQDAEVKSSFHPCDFKPTKFSLVDNSNANKFVSSTSGKRQDSSEPVAEKLENHPARSARFLPCHYFTYAAGSSTGGLICIMLQRLRMTVDECIEEYQRLGAEVFGRPRLPVINKVFPKFDETHLVNAIKGVCKRRGEEFTWGELNYTPSFRTEQDLFCRCMVLAISYQGDSRKLYPFRTYETRPRKTAVSKGAISSQKSKGYGEPSQLPVWEVARATSAAPGYFAPINIRRGDGKMIKFKDGGFGHNNPSQQIYNDVVLKHEERDVGVLVSIGTGERETKFWSASNHLVDMYSNLKAAIKLPSMTTQIHENMEMLSKENKKFFYVRLDGGKELGKMDLDEWDSHKLTRITDKNPNSGQKTLENIHRATSRYLEQEDTKKLIAE